MKFILFFFWFCSFNFHEGFEINFPTFYYENLKATEMLKEFCHLDTAGNNLLYEFFCVSIHFAISLLFHQFIVGTFRVSCEAKYTVQTIHLNTSVYITSANLSVSLFLLK